MSIGQRKTSTPVQTGEAPSLGSHVKIRQLGWVHGHTVPSVFPDRPAVSVQQPQFYLVLRLPAIRL